MHPLFHLLYFIFGMFQLLQVVFVREAGGSGILQKFLEFQAEFHFKKQPDLPN